MTIARGKIRIYAMNDKERIGARIIELRNELNLKQEELAQMSGLTRSTISKIERGRYNVSLDILSKLVRPLGVKIELVKAAE